MKNKKEILPFSYSNKEDKSHEEHLDSLKWKNDLSKKIEDFLSERGINIPENINLGLLCVDEFRRTVKETQALRQFIVNYNLEEIGTNNEEKNEVVEKAIKMFIYKKLNIDWMIDTFGESLEAEHRDIIAIENDYGHF